MLLTSNNRKPGAYRTFGAGKSSITSGDGAGVDSTAGVGVGVGGTALGPLHRETTNRTIGNAQIASRHPQHLAAVIISDIPRPPQRAGDGR